MYRDKINDVWLAALCKTLNTTMTRIQGDAVRFITSECDQYGITDNRMVAYILATCYHESRFKSIPEIRAEVGTEIWKMQEKYWHTGYYGRGYSQITWRKNYHKFSQVVGRDLVKNPDDVLIPEVGAKILVYGMYFAAFSGVGLKKYFTDKKTDWLGARRIVNGNFQADRVAVAAQKILPLLM